MSCTKTKNVLCYSQLINLLESIPEDYRDKQVVMSQNWNDKDFYPISFERLDRKTRIILSVCRIGGYTVNELIGVLKLNAKKYANALVSLRLNGTRFTNYYIIDNFNFSYGQDVIYIELHRLG